VSLSVFLSHTLSPSFVLFLLIPLFPLFPLAFLSLFLHTLPLFVAPHLFSLLPLLTASSPLIIIIIIIYISTQTQFKGTAAKALTWLQDRGSDKPVGMWMFDDEMKMNDFSKKN
jgi:hypothetical protein